VIRSAELRDFAAILALNEDGRVVGFLLAVGPGQPYESLNYRWFATRHDDFLYIDRVVVGGAHQRSGVGAALYDDVAAFAAAHGYRRLVCEVNIEPPNPGSDAFHARRGFVEVGTQWVADGTKRVALLELAVGGERPG
jgi:predicted GNAT superfamily acetyltransferase